MWNALPITADIYGFQAEVSFWAPFAAVAQVSGPEDRALAISVRIYPMDLANEAQYAMLLEAIRGFARELSVRAGVSKCTLLFLCRGHMRPEAALPMPSKPLQSGLLAAELEFAEEIAV